MNDRRSFILSSLNRSLMLLGGGVLASSWKTLPDQISAGDPAADLARIKAILETKTPVKWVFVGDSITHGAKHTFGARSYPEIFGERIRWELRRVRDVIINTAISGNTATDTSTVGTSTTVPRSTTSRSQSYSASRRCGTSLRE